MPLFYQHNINDSKRLAVWHITEDEDFFLQKVSGQNEIMHPHKRLQHLAGRYLLQFLQSDFPFQDIRIAPSKKPFVLQDNLHFSLSHCKDYAAAIISKDSPVGIDVEWILPKIERVKERFLSPPELDLCQSESNKRQESLYKMVTLFWCAKECIYKWDGRGQLSFKRNMKIHEIVFEKQEGFLGADFIKDQKIALHLPFRFFGDLCLAWV